MTEQSIRDRLEYDFKEAFRGKKELEVSVLRMLKSAILNAEILKGGKGSFDDTQVLDMIKKEAKKRHDSIAAYAQGGRNDLADKEKQELAILQKYLPAQMSEEEARILVQKVIRDFGVSSASDFGKIMKESAARSQGKADGRLLSQIVKDILSK